MQIIHGSKKKFSKTTRKYFVLNDDRTPQVVLVVKNLPPNAGDRDVRDMGSFPGSGRSPGGGHGSPFLPGESYGLRSLAGYSPRVAKSQTQLKPLSTQT